MPKIVGTELSLWDFLCAPLLQTRLGDRSDVIMGMIDLEGLACAEAHAPANQRHHPPSDHVGPIIEGGVPREEFTEGEGGAGAGETLGESSKDPAGVFMDALSRQTSFQQLGDESPNSFYDTASSPHSKRFEY